jgi:CxxC motif-containing protein (DUF1111 family)
MNKMKHNGILFFILLLTATSALTAAPPLSGGGTSFVVSKFQADSRGLFSLPAPNLSLVRRDNFFIGDSFFRGAWITAPASTAARDGLGPIFNTNSCQTCHIKDGRGHPPDTEEEMISTLVRISVPDAEGAAPEILARSGGVTPHPVYGDQIQNRAILGHAPEANVSFTWETIPGKFPDGQTFSLRRPSLVVSNPGYGDFGAATRYSPRVAQPMIGVGLLDTIKTADIEALADPDDTDGDGISGRINQVWDVQTKTVVSGRFGWKAEQPTVRQQVAAAFFGDIGITTTLFPSMHLTEPQKILSGLPHGGHPEVSDEILNFVTFYSKTLAVPAQRSHDNPVVVAGRSLFLEAKCHTCHVETFTTGKDNEFPELSLQEIHPYTDLLLHDLGEGLADERPVYSADGQEWRTAPLWGIGLAALVNQNSNFLHDGRARTLEEAILWHGGEAEVSRNTYFKMTAGDRRKLIAFLESL